jgi:RNA polymerase sigma factor (sigma-70 family)
MPTALDLFERHHVAVFRFLRGMRLPTQDAEDLTQEVFLRVLRGLSRYEERQTERAWVFRIARNVWIDHLRARDRAPASLPRGDPRGLATPPGQVVRAAIDEALARIGDRRGHRHHPGRRPEPDPQGTARVAAGAGGSARRTGFGRTGGVRMDANEVLSAFVDGEQVEPAELASALDEPGAREALIDLVRFRAALADDSRPSQAFVERMRERLGGRRAPWRARPLRLGAAAAVLALAAVGALDLSRRLRPEPPPDEPPAVSRVIRYKPGVDWLPVQGR